MGCDRFEIARKQFLSSRNCKFVHKISYIIYTHRYLQKKFGIKIHMKKTNIFSLEPNSNLSLYATQSRHIPQFNDIIYRGYIMGGFVYDFYPCVRM